MKIYYSNASGVTVYLMRDVRKKDPTKDCPLKFCVTYRRKRAYYSTGYKMNANNWARFEEADLKDFDFKTKVRDLKEAKDDILKYFDERVKPAVEELADGFSFDAFNVLLTGESKDKNSVNDAFLYKIETLRKENKIGNADVYQTTYGTLKRFQYYKLLRSKDKKQAFKDACRENRHKTVGAKVISLDAPICFDEVTAKFLTECEDFWRETDLSDNSIGMYMRTLRALINNKDGGTPFLSGSRYPFGEGAGKYQIPEGGRRSIALPIQDVWKIENFNAKCPSLILARDIFMFMFYCNGLNFGDLCRLTYKDIDTPSAEIVFLRKKTLKRGKKPEYIYAPILKPMTEIIARHGNEKFGDYIFPFLNGIAPLNKNEQLIKDTIKQSLAPINSALKVIATELELDPGLSTAYTRNSYITYLVSELYVNPIVVKKMVGHSTKKDVTAGYVNLTAKKRREINTKLLNPEREYKQSIIGFNIKTV